MIEFLITGIFTDTFARLTGTKSTKPLQREPSARAFRKSALPGRRRGPVKLSIECHSPQQYD